MVGILLEYGLVLMSIILTFEILGAKRKMVPQIYQIVIIVFSITIIFSFCWNIYLLIRLKRAHTKIEELNALTTYLFVWGYDRKQSEKNCTIKSEDLGIHSEQLGYAYWSKFVQPAHIIRQLSKLWAACNSGYPRAANRIHKF